jgi:hypothetical protein
MKSKIYFILFIITMSINYSKAQTKMIVSKKHTILANIPKNWVQVQDGPVPFFIVPDENNVSDKTYIYVFGNDYETAPEINNWIEIENQYQIENNKGVKIGEVELKFENIQKDNFLTGKYKVITYDYLDKSRQITLVIECKTTIVIVVLNTIDEDEKNKYMKHFIDISKTIKIMGSTVKN